MDNKELDKLLCCKSNQSKYSITNISSVYNYANELQNKEIKDILVSAKIDSSELEACNNSNNPDLLLKIIFTTFFGIDFSKLSNFGYDNDNVTIRIALVNTVDNKYIAESFIPLCSINFNNDIEEDFYNSSVFKRINNLLVIFFSKSTESQLFYKNLFTSLYKPTEKDLVIIERDYENINKKILNGLSYTLTRSDGDYLSTSSKGYSDSDIVYSCYGGPGFVNRNFILRNSYVQILLNGNINSENSLVSSIEELKKLSIEEIIKERFNPFINKSIDEIAELLDIKIKKVLNKNKMESLSKATLPVITAKMLNVSSLNTEEFQKAGIAVKTIDFDEKGENIQQFRFADADFLEINNTPDFIEREIIDNDGTIQIIKESGWEKSFLYKQLDQLKYLFVIFQEKENQLYFKGCKLWAMSEKDLELAHKDWLEIKDVLRKGVILKRVPWGNDERTENNFPGIADSRVVHLRPHGAKSYYVTPEGCWGNGSISDTKPLPDGRRMTRQSYWLKNVYVKAIVKELLF